MIKKPEQDINPFEPVQYYRCFWDECHNGDPVDYSIRLVMDYLGFGKKQQAIKRTKHKQIKKIQA